MLQRQQDRPLPACPVAPHLQGQGRDKTHPARQLPQVEKWGTVMHMSLGPPPTPQPLPESMSQEIPRQVHGEARRDSASYPTSQRPCQDPGTRHSPRASPSLAAVLELSPSQYLICMVSPSQCSLGFMWLRPPSLPLLSTWSQLHCWPPNSVPACLPCPGQQTKLCCFFWLFLWLLPAPNLLFQHPFPGSCRSSGCSRYLMNKVLAAGWLVLGPVPHRCCPLLGGCAWLGSCWCFRLIFVDSSLLRATEVGVLLHAQHCSLSREIPGTDGSGSIRQAGRTEQLAPAREHPLPCQQDTCSLQEQQGTGGTTSARGCGREGRGGTAELPFPAFSYRSESTCQPPAACDNKAWPHLGLPAVGNFVQNPSSGNGSSMLLLHLPA